ncbi:MAG: tyrosine-type recombinase/integrase, partial [Phormidesmis sp.]
QSPKIANQNLFLLKAFGRWAVEHKHCRENLFETIRTHKGTSQKVQDSTPISREELALILETMRSHPPASHYYAFTVVLISLGLRPSEAIGLRWRCVNVGNRQMSISEARSRAADGKSAGKSRQRKGTKTGTSRTLPLNDRLISLFQERWYLTADPDGLIFSAPGGGPIDDRNYRNRCWKECCKLAGIRYRPPYTSRHTMLTYGLEYEGWTERQAAAMAGHANTRMISETYGHLMNMPELPNLEPPAP